MFLFFCSEEKGGVFVEGEDQGMEEEKSVVVLEVPSSYVLADATGHQLAAGQAQARLEKENLSILPQFGEPLLITYREIIQFSPADYRVALDLTSKEKVTLSDLGLKYEDFIRELSRLRNEMLIKDMLMNESLKDADAGAEFVYSDESGAQASPAQCKLRLYETALVIMPEKGEVTRIPYSDFAGLREEDHKLVLKTDFGEEYIFSQMGRDFDRFKKTLSDLMNELSLKVQANLKELFPLADSSVIRQLARLMREGRAAKKSDIESISLELWQELEKRILSSSINEEYQFLRSMAQPEKISIGIKRGLMGDLTGEYTWFLMPIYSADPAKPGNAVAMEAVSDEGGGRATYFFRLVDKNDYSSFKDLEELHREADTFIKTINHCLLAVNFRREPIYLSDDKLREPQYVKYLIAMQKLPALQTLRRLYIGRVIHSSPEQWKKDVAELLKVNISR